MTRADDIAYGSARGRWVIAATVLGSGMALIDSSVVTIALPTIGRRFGATIGTLQWVVTGYMLTLAALLLLGGSLGDRFGRRLVFCIGVVWFTLASAACGLAPNATSLVVARVVQGVGAALLTPGSLAILQASFAPRDRGRAIGAWAGLGGLAAAAGPLLGGYLISALSWRWIFFINLPMGVLVMVLSIRHVPESRDPGATRLDFGGAVVGISALAAFTYGMIEGPSWGFASPSVWAVLVAGAIGVGAFILIERRSTAPMLPLEIFGRRQFSVTNVVTLIVYAALGGALFLIPVELQVVNHYTPLEAGASLVPLTVVMLVLSPRSGQLSARVGPRLQMAAGPVGIGVGLGLLLFSTGSGSYLTGVLPGLLVFALGMVTTVAPLTTTALGSAPAEHAGIASAVNNYVARVGSLLAVAILPAIAGISGKGYAHRAALAPAFRRAMLVTGAMCVVGGIVAAFGITNPVKPYAASGAVVQDERRPAAEAPSRPDEH